MARGIGSDGKMLWSVAKANQKLDREMAAGKCCSACAIVYGTKSPRGIVAKKDARMTDVCEECARDFC